MLSRPGPRTHFIPDSIDQPSASELEAKERYRRSAISGRKGQRRRQDRIRAAVHGGPKELLEGINALYSIHEVSSKKEVRVRLARASAAWRDIVTDRSEEILPIILALYAMGQMAERMIAGGPRCVEAREVLNGTMELVTELRSDSPALSDPEALKKSLVGTQVKIQVIHRVGKDGNVVAEVGAILPGNNEPPPVAGFLKDANCQTAVDMLLRFWAADDVEFLNRLRKCALADVPVHFFLDQSNDQHAQYCGDAHRKKAHRQPIPASKIPSDVA